jgi:hypothetical protein
MDTTPFNWFGDKRQYSLHGGIDDATGKIVGLYMTKNECLQGYFETTRQIILHYGIPISIYSDRHAIFLSIYAGKLTIEDELEGKVCNDTQFGRALKELGITIIPAWSPQAKGRVERLWETLQSRLPIEFGLAGISNIDEANEFLESYICEFNKLFAVEPSEAESAFRPLEESINLDNILCVKKKRKVDNGGIFTFYGKQFKIEPRADQPIIPPKSEVKVLVRSIPEILVEYNGNYYITDVFVKSEKVVMPRPAIVHNIPVCKPQDDHFFKYGQNLYRNVSYEEHDRDILNMVQDIFLGKSKKLG